MRTLPAEPETPQTGQECEKPRSYTFTLAYPPSANRYWRRYRTCMVVSDEARTYKRVEAMRARIASTRL